MARRRRSDEQGLLFPGAAGPERAPAREPRAKRPARPTVRYARFADVAVNRPVRCEFTYGVPAELAAAIRPGMRVAVSFGSGREVGVVVGLSDECALHPARLKPVAALLDEEPILDAALLGLTRWMAAEYACSWGEALAAVLPAALKRESPGRGTLVVEAAEGVGDAELEELVDRFPKQHRLLRTLLALDGPIELREVERRLNVSSSPARSLERRGWVHLKRVRVSADPLLTPTGIERQRPERLSDAQAAAVAAIGAALRGGEPESFLLHGVTGSGKTEVYLRAIEEALAVGRTGIVLVPEIALTPQTVGWFRGRFGEVAVLHSRMTDSQRLDMWLRARAGEVRVVVGARSAIFAPLPDLGVVVVDEEHEPSFKQGNAPRYHARDVALERARRSGAVCVLGSATPALETWRAACDGRMKRLELPHRVTGGALPAVEIVDMRTEKPSGAGPKLFSHRLEQLLRDALREGRQAILFLNRRGFAPVLWCRACGEAVRCTQCDVTLTFHRRIRRLVCHTCCEELAPPEACPACTAPALRYLGLGSERVESALAELLPEARIARMDSDTMLRREDYERTLGAFERGELDVLVGTQMIAKGLDFPNVTVVGIVSADSALYLPDFRAAERTFQLLAQVAGRAGRGEHTGRIVVQSMAPEHPAILRAAQHDYDGFARHEDELREELGYPPHGRLIRVLVEDPSEAVVDEVCDACAALVEAEVDDPALELLGPAPAPIALVRGRHRRHLLVKCPLGSPSFDRVRELLVRFAGEATRARVGVDVDPVSML